MRQLAALLMAFALPVIAGDARWERLKNIRSGEKIWIEYMQGDQMKSEKAEMAAWQEDSLAIRVKKADVVLARTDVRKVSVYGGKSRAKGAGYGALIGSAIGAGVYGIAVATAGDIDMSKGAIVAAGTLVVGGVGTLVGTAVGATKHVKMYDARDAERERAAVSPTAPKPVEAASEQAVAAVQ